MTDDQFAAIMTKLAKLEAAMAALACRLDANDQGLGEVINNQAGLASELRANNRRLADLTQAVQDKAAALSETKAAVDQSQKTVREALDQADEDRQADDWWKTGDPPPC